MATATDLEYVIEMDISSAGATQTKAVVVSQGPEEPVKPKKVSSAYMYFMKENRQRIKDENDGTTFEDWLQQHALVQWGKQPLALEARRLYF
jgi:hypothetical protein